MFVEGIVGSSRPLILLLPALSTLELVDTVGIDARGTLHWALHLLVVDLLERVADDSVLRPVDGRAASDADPVRQLWPVGGRCGGAVVVGRGPVVAPLLGGGGGGQVLHEVLRAPEGLALDVPQSPDVGVGAAALHLEQGDCGLEGDDVGIVLEVEGLGRRDGDGRGALWVGAVGEAEDGGLAGGGGGGGSLGGSDG